MFEKNKNGTNGTREKKGTLIHNIGHRSYQPSNGTAGINFTTKFCDQCIHLHPDPERNPQCEILMRSMCYSIGDPQYPIEWRYDANDNPVCTSFSKWNWGNADKGYNEPVEIIPTDPGQLELHFGLIRWLGNHHDLLICNKGIFQT